MTQIADQGSMPDLVWRIGVSQRLAAPAEHTPALLAELVDQGTFPKVLPDGRLLRFFTKPYVDPSERPVLAPRVQETQLDLLRNRWTAEPGRKCPSKALETVQYPQVIPLFPDTGRRDLQLMNHTAQMLPMGSGSLMPETYPQPDRLIAMLGFSPTHPVGGEASRLSFWSWPGDPPDLGYLSLLPYLAQGAPDEWHRWMPEVGSCLIGHPTLQGRAVAICPGNAGLLLDPERPPAKAYSIEAPPSPSGAAIAVRSVGTIFAYGSLAALWKWRAQCTLGEGVYIWTSVSVPASLPKPQPKHRPIVPSWWGLGEQSPDSEGGAWPSPPGRVHLPKEGRTPPPTQEDGAHGQTEGEAEGQGEAIP